MSTIRELAAALKGDGCTSAPDLSYVDCCHEHDVYYRTGCDVAGVPISRREADRRLRLCMRQAGKTPVLGRWLLPWVYWAAVRLCGRRAWTTAQSASGSGSSSPS